MYESKETLEQLYGATMTINEVRSAVISMPPFTKFSHPYFCDDEYLYRNANGEVLLEDGCPVTSEFWALRSQGVMADNWYIKEQAK